MDTTSKHSFSAKALHERNERTAKLLKSFAETGVNGGYLSYAMIQDLIDETFPGKDYDVFASGCSGTSALVLWGKSIDPKTKLRRRKYIIENCKSFDEFKWRVAVLCGITTEEEAARKRAEANRAKRYEKIKIEFARVDTMILVHEDRIEFHQKEIAELEASAEKMRIERSKLAIKLHTMKKG